MKNLPKDEVRALKELKSDSSIVIKEADKGSAVVLMDADYYDQCIKSMLKDIHTYKEVAENTDKRTLLNIKKLLQNHKIDNQDLCDYLTNFDCKTANFYGLPKVHKSKQIISAIKEQNSSYVTIHRPDDLSFRPIVAGPACPTSRLSQVVDEILKPLVQNVKSYVRDDIDFLTKLPQDITNQEDGQLVTLDAVSLYTNIDKELGLCAIEYWMDKHPDLVPEFSTDFVKSAVELILDSNLFHFDDKYYLQTSGTAMGTKMAPTYATLAVGYMEEMLYADLRRSQGDVYANYVMDNWKPFLDDCFIFWKDQLGSVEAFQQKLNSMTSQLKFTMSASRTEMPFLDILILNNDGTLETDIYYKDTDSHNYVPFNSCHPHHTKINIPYSLARRICTIVDNQARRDKRLEEMTRFLVEKGYPLMVIKDGITKARSLDLATLRTPSNKAYTNDRNVLTFVYTHNPNNPNTQKDIDSSLSVLGTSDRMRTIMGDTKVIKSRRQPPNLKHLLTAAKFTRGQDSPAYVTKCGDKRCKCCTHIQRSNSVKFESGMRFEVKTNMDCNSSNLIYVITCAGCNGQYIGETGDVLRNRVRVHRQHINDANTRQLKVSEHIDKCSNKEPKFWIFPFYKLSNSDTTFRREKEQFFIRKAKPTLN